MKQSVTQQNDLLNGSILKGLSRLALPIMMTSFIQMAYNLTDMIWIGRIGSGAVAAVGAAGIYLWISESITMIARMGGQVKVAHSIGGGNQEDASRYAAESFHLGILLAALFALLVIVFHPGLVGFFRLGDAQVEEQARNYLLVTGTIGVCFAVINMVFTGICTGKGDSKLPFMATSVGLVLNVILDPLLIFGLGPLPAMGVIGAAVATAGSQGIVMLLFLMLMGKSKDRTFFLGIPFFGKPQFGYLKEVWKIGFPAGIQSVFMSGLSLVISRVVASWGPSAIAVQKVGGQIESLAWMIFSGFSMAVNAFIGQNYGAGQMKRVRQGYRVALGLMFVWGCFCTLLLLAVPEVLFRIFITEEELIPMGADYLRIVGMCELFCCLEGAAIGAFNGLGQTKIPSLASVVFYTARIPLAVFLSRTGLGLNGIWLGLSLGSIIKAVIVTVWYQLYARRFRAEE